MVDLHSFTLLAFGLKIPASSSGRGLGRSFRGGITTGGAYLMRNECFQIKTRCSQCDYEPGSLSQLSVHVRTVHNEVQAYVCRLCGYRGFSLRGIRSHMRFSSPHYWTIFAAILHDFLTFLTTFTQHTSFRSHSELDAMKFEFLLANHISKVKTERKSPENQENMEDW